MIHVIATVRVKAGQRAEFLDHIHRLVPEVRAERGCLEYGPTVDLKTDIAAQRAADENVVVVVERWDSLEALQTHLVAPHMQRYRQAVADLVEDVSLQILQPT